MKRVFLLVGLGLITGMTLAAQSAEQDVKKALMDGNRAAIAHDAAGYGRLLADDLQWLTADGKIERKADRLKGVSTGNPPTANEISVKVYGDTAVAVVAQTSANGTKGRALRTLVKRDGRWQLVAHAQADLR